MALALGAVLTFAGTAVCAQHLGPGDLAARPVSPPTKVEAYGADPLQFGQLRMPRGKGPFSVAIIIHGGCWTKGFATLDYMSPLAARLAERGVATWNIEYRQLGDPGAGWPGSFLDWAAGADHLRSLAKTYPLDLKRVVVVGHSAGAHAALWVAARRRLAADSPIRGAANPLRPIAAIAVDGPGDLAEFIAKDEAICGKPVIAPFMGGSPADAPDHYAQGSPISLAPSGARETLVASKVLTADEADRYRAGAVARGAHVQVVTVEDAGHFDMLAPDRPAGVQVETLILRAVRAIGPVRP